jgi:hypothetical protein
LAAEESSSDFHTLIAVLEDATHNMPPPFSGFAQFRVYDDAESIR